MTPRSGGTGGDRTTTHRCGGARAGRLAACVLTGVCAGLLGVVASPAAWADPVPASGEGPGKGRRDDGDGIRPRVGNGTGNHSVVSVRSPTTNHGYQHTSATTAGGATSIQNALCRHARVCNITLQVIVVSPERPRRPARKPQAPAPAEAEETQETASGCDRRRATPPGPVAAG
ncbi:hypothetical protein [Sphaerisporangium sp. TRM90804]|uniref:hypothetical protein n=1 Tax=Sphaerisporangium sp. TRM90804 TaxID=3031113 RepID=UPI00244A1DDC|nr:hypothetical protein [Sphaerisporangium sp. TRM90804]MDH2430747.1 hypothetical protein [Sphaerisporangium sp. TRM90804]